MIGEQAAVGVELEFTRLGARAAGDALRRSLGGVLEIEDRHAVHLRGSEIGDLSIEIDLRHAHPHRDSTGVWPRLGPRGAAVLGTLASPFAPREIIFPPRPPQRLGDIDRAVEILRRAGARGDGSATFDTLGLHFNIAAHRLDVATIRRTTLTFARRDAAMRARIAGDDPQLMARLAPPYPRRYVDRLRSADAGQSIAEFTDDYLAFNPTRRRALDLLPLLLHLDAPRIRAALPREKIAARPVYHWRLPVARVERPGWTVLDDWNDWIELDAAACRKLAAA